MAHDARLLKFQRALCDGGSDDLGESTCNSGTLTGYRQAHLECVRTLLLDDAADKSVLNTYMAELNVNVF